VILEAFLLNQFKTRNIQYALLQGVRMANKFRIDGHHTAFKCRQNDALLSVFVVNHSPCEIDVKSRSGQHYLLKPGHIYCLHNISPSDELLATYVGLGKVFRHPVETMRMGAFKKQGANLCPDWMEEPAP
jgi:hypothetical protein